MAKEVDIRKKNAKELKRKFREHMKKQKANTKANTRKVCRP